MRPLNNYNMIGVLLAIIFININFGNKAGTPPALAFNWYPYIIQGSLHINGYHIHHWMFSAFLLLFLIPLQINHKNKLLLIVNGFFLTLMIQGLLYEDRFVM